MVTHGLESAERGINQDRERDERARDTHILERAKAEQVRAPKNASCRGTRAWNNSSGHCDTNKQGQTHRILRGDIS